MQVFPHTIPQELLLGLLWVLSILSSPSSLAPRRLGVLSFLSSRGLVEEPLGVPPIRDFRIGLRARIFWEFCPDPGLHTQSGAAPQLCVFVGLWFRVI